MARRAGLDITTHPSWRSLFERDVDVHVLDLMHSSELYRGWLQDIVATNLTGEGQYLDIAGAWHSGVADLGPESDVEANDTCPVGRFSFLIKARSTPGASRIRRSGISNGHVASSPVAGRPGREASRSRRRCTHSATGRTRKRWPHTPRSRASPSGASAMVSVNGGPNSPGCSGTRSSSGAGRAPRMTWLAFRIVRKSTPL